MSNESPNNNSLMAPDQVVKKIYPVYSQNKKPTDFDLYSVYDRIVEKYAETIKFTEIYKIDDWRICKRPSHCLLLDPPQIRNIIDLFILVNKLINLVDLKIKDKNGIGEEIKATFHDEWWNMPKCSLDKKKREVLDDYFSEISNYEVYKLIKLIEEKDAIKDNYFARIMKDNNKSLWIDITDVAYFHCDLIHELFTMAKAVLRWENVLNEY